MGRPRLKDTTAYSRMVHTRLRLEEDTGLKQLAAALNVPPSRIMRRLLREAINGGPDYFADGVKEIRMMHVHLAAVGPQPEPARQGGEPRRPSSE